MTQEIQPPFSNNDLNPVEAATAILLLAYGQSPNPSDPVEEITRRIDKPDSGLRVVCLDRGHNYQIRGDDLYFSVNPVLVSILDPFHEGTDVIYSVFLSIHSPIEFDAADRDYLGLLRDPQNSVEVVIFRSNFIKKEEKQKRQPGEKFQPGMFYIINEQGQKSLNPPTPNLDLLDDIMCFLDPGDGYINMIDNMLGIDSLVVAEGTDEELDGEDWETVDKPESSITIQTGIPTTKVIELLRMIKFKSRSFY